MLNQQSDSNNSIVSGTNKNIDNIIKEEVKPMDILFPKYDQYSGNLDTLILYKDGMFLKLSENSITIQIDNSLSMFFKKQYNEEELKTLIQGIENTFSYFFNCLDKNNIDDVKNEIVNIYQKDAYYNILTVKEHIHNTLIMMQKANIGLNKMNKYYKSYWQSQFNDAPLYNIYTINTQKLDMMLNSNYLNNGMTELKYDDGYQEVPLEDDVFYDDEENYQYTSDGGDSSSVNSGTIGPTYLTNTQNEAYFFNPDVIEKQPSSLPSPSPLPIRMRPIQYACTHDDGAILINKQEAIDNGEIDDNYEEIDRGNMIDNNCQYIGNELHECFDVENKYEHESLDLSTEEKQIGSDIDYFDYLNEEVTEESERIRQEMEERRIREIDAKEKWYIKWLNQFKYTMRIVGEHMYGAWIYVKNGTMNAYNNISSSLNSWYYGDSRNNNKAKAF